MLTKSMLEALLLIVRGIDTIKDLARSMKKSRNWISEILTKLEEEAFIKKQRIGLTKKIRLSDSEHAQKFKNLVYKNSSLRLIHLLYGERLRILCFLADSPKNTFCISKELKTSRKYIQKVLSEFYNLAVLKREKRQISISDKAYPHLVAFLLSFRNFSPLNAGVLWKFEDEMVLLINNKTKKGVKTGFNRYSQNGVKLYPIKTTVYLPEKELSKEEIFIHSLLNISNDIRLFKLAVVFYLKHNLSKQKLNYLAMKFNVSEQLSDIKTAVISKQETIKLRTIKNIIKSDLNKTLALYNVQSARDNNAVKSDFS